MFISANQQTLKKNKRERKEQKMCHIESFREKTQQNYRNYQIPLNNNP
jgi:hypothetical protein